MHWSSVVPSGLETSPSPKNVNISWQDNEPLILSVTHRPKRLDALLARAAMALDRIRGTDCRLFFF